MTPPRGPVRVDSRVVHFVSGLREADEPFHLLHYLAVASCRPEADEVPTIAAHRKWAKRCAELVLLRASGRIADATEAHLRWAQTPLGYLASPDLPDHGLS